MSFEHVHIADKESACIGCNRLARLPRLEKPGPAAALHCSVAGCGRAFVDLSGDVKGCAVHGVQFSEEEKGKGAGKSFPAGRVAGLGWPKSDKAHSEAEAAPAKEFRVRWAIGSISGPWMIPLFPSETREGARGGRGPTTQVPCFDQEMFKPKARLDAEGKPETKKRGQLDPLTGQWKQVDTGEEITYTEGSPLDEGQLKAQGKAMAQLEKRLKADGFQLSHTDPEGWQVYKQVGKVRGRR